MKRIFLIPLFVIIAVISCSQDSSRDFGEAKWGMNPEQVVKIEGNDYHVNYPGDRIVYAYKRIYLNEPVYRNYVFINNKLTNGIIIFEKNIYDNAKKDLVEKYGKPSTDNDDNLSCKWSINNKSTTIELTSNQTSTKIYFNN